MEQILRKDSDVEKNVGWIKLWDAALDLGVNHAKSLKILSRLMSHCGCGLKPCPLCDKSCSLLLVFLIVY